MPTAELTNPLPPETYLGISLRGRIDLHEMLTNGPEGFSLFKYHKAREDLACAELLRDAGSEGTVALRAVDDEKRFVIVSPSLEKADGWRATRFDEYGPIGHTEFKTRRNALLCFSGAFSEGPPYAGEWSYRVEKIMVSAKRMVA